MHWVFVAALRLSLVAASRGYSSLQGSGFSQPWPLLLWSMASRCMGLISCCTRAQQLQREALRARGLSSRSVRLSGHSGSAVAACGSQGTRGQQSQRAALRALRVSSCGNRLSCSMACEMFLDPGLNPCPWHWQVDSYPLCHRGSPPPFILNLKWEVIKQASPGVD